jgi:hypothetical protein
MMSKPYKPFAIWPEEMPGSKRWGIKKYPCPMRRRVIRLTDRRWGRPRPRLLGVDIAPLVPTQKELDFSKSQLEFEQEFLRRANQYFGVPPQALGFGSSAANAS